MGLPQDGWFMEIHENPNLKWMIKVGYRLGKAPILTCSTSSTQGAFVSPQKVLHLRLFLGFNAAPWRYTFRQAPSTTGEQVFGKAWNTWDGRACFFWNLFHAVEWDCSLPWSLWWVEPISFTTFSGKMWIPVIRTPRGHGGRSMLGFPVHPATGPGW